MSLAAVLFSLFMIGFEKLRACLETHKTEWYHPVFITHDPKLVGPTEEQLFGFCDSYSVTQFSWFCDSKKRSDSEGKWKLISAVFITYIPLLSGNFVILLRLWAPKARHCHIPPVTLSLSLFFFFFSPFFSTFLSFFLSSSLSILLCVLLRSKKLILTDHSHRSLTRRSLTRWPLTRRPK